MVRSCTIRVSFVGIFMSPKDVKVVVILLGRPVGYQLSNVLTNYFSSFETLSSKSVSYRIIPYHHHHHHHHQTEEGGGKKKNLPAMLELRSLSQQYRPTQS